jgi:tRNA nucleotidyltransferase (CCA-adding enzyme)
LRIPIKIKSIMQKLIDNNFECYIIGGAVRDYLLGLEPHDYDLFTNANGKDIKKLFPNGIIIGGAERQKKILTVIVDGVEVSQFRKSGDRTLTGADLITHQYTCDFYINALAIDINGEFSGDTLILQNGLDDIRHKLLRFVGDPESRVKEDKLRILRGIRFMLKYNLNPSIETSKIINRTFLTNLPIERISKEFVKLLEFKDSIKILHQYNLLKQILPELYHENHFKDGGSHHNETPFEHMCEAFKQACRITTDYRIRLAALLHDISKGDVREEDGDNIHFYQHETKGYEITKQILERLKFSNDDITFISTIVKKHMFGYLETIQDKTYVKFYAELESKNISIYDFLMVVYCDRQANLKKPRDSFGDFCKKSNEKYLLYHYNRIKSKHYPFTIKDLEINGKDLINLGIKPGLEIGNHLRKIYDLVLEGELKNSRPELMYYLKTGEIE